MQPSDYRATRNVCYVGNASHAIVNNLAPLLFIIFLSDYGLSYHQLGALVSINFGIQLLMDAACIRLADRMGYRPPLVAAHLLCASGLVLLGVLPRATAHTFAALVASVAVYAAGGGILEVLISPVIDNLPVSREEKASSMSMLHSFYCWGQIAVVLITTLLLQIIGRPRWYILPLLWALVPLWNMIRFLRVPMPPSLPAEKAMGLGALLKSPVFFAFMVMMLCAGASELTIAQWASLFAEQGLGLSKVWGDLLGPCMFAVMMALGRTIYGLWGSRINLNRCMLACGVLCVLCYLGATLIPNRLANLAFCALSGLAVCIMWPGTFSLASARFPLGGTALFAVLALMGDLGCSAGPWLAGWAADRAEAGGIFYRINLALFGGGSGLSVGLLAAALFPVLLLLVLWLSRRARSSLAED